MKKKIWKRYKLFLAVVLTSFLLAGGVATLIWAAAPPTPNPQSFGTNMWRLVFGYDSANDVLRAIRVKPDGSLTTSTNAGAPAATANAAVTVTADAAVHAATANLRLIQICFTEAAGSPGTAEVIPRVNAMGANCNTGAPIPARVTLNPREWVCIPYGDRGVNVAAGVCVDWVSGTTEVTTKTVVE